MLNRTGYPSDPVVSDGFDRAAFHGLDALGLLLGIFRLLVNVRVAPVVAAGEIGGSRLAAEVAIDALVIDIEFPVMFSEYLFSRSAMAVIGLDPPR